VAHRSRLGVRRVVVLIINVAIVVYLWRRKEIFDG
jgi:uncharacterized membrane protein (DUF2068 family)